MTELGAATTRVLLVDDHALLRTAVRQAITAPDIEVVGEAATAAAALEAIETLAPDLVLLDIGLPDASGLSLLRDIRQRAPATRVLVLTVSGAERDLIEAIRLGAIGYLTKDLEPAALLESIRAARDGDVPIPHRLAAAAIARLSRSGDEGGAARGTLDSLTDRELEVLRRISGGETDRAAAAELGISTRTVEAHVGRILAKLGVRNRAEAASTYRLPHPEDPGGIRR